MASKRRKKKGASSQPKEATPPVGATSDELVRLLDKQPGALAVTGDGASTLYVNPAAARLLKKRAKQLLGEPFPYPLEDGPMRDLDVEMKLDQVEWAQIPCTMVFLRPLKVTQAPFHIEWRIESAQERARTAEARIQALEAELDQARAAQPPSEPATVDEAAPTQEADPALAELEQRLAEATDELDGLRHTVQEHRDAAAEQQRLEDELQQALSRAEAAEERLEEMEALLEAAEQRADEAAVRVAAESQEATDQLQETMRHIEEVEAQLKASEERARDAEERIQAAEDQAEVAEERAYEAEGLLAEAEEKAEQVEELRGEFERLSLEAQELRQNLELSQARAQEAEQRLAELEGSETLAEEAQALRERLEDAEKRAKKSGVRFREAEARATRAEAELAELRTQAASATEAADQGALQELQDELDRTRAQLERVTELAGGGDVEKLERQVQGALQRAVEAEEQLRESQAAVDQLKQDSATRVAELEAEIEQLRDGPTEDGQVDPETQRLAFQDDLTGLPNVNIIKRYLDFMLKQAERYERACALLAIDLDRFKLVNDALGFKVGDELLKLVAERLSVVVRGSDVLGRRGEDEFMILLSELSGQEEATSMAAAVARRVYEVLQAPFTVGDQKIHIGVSVGISMFPTDARSAQQMVEHADSSMYRAKELGRGRYQFYTPELQTRHEGRLRLDAELREALEKQQFRLLYQPIFNLGTGQMVGVESLLRWQHPTRGLLAPEEFLDQAEETGLIVPIGRWSIVATLTQASRWKQEGLNLFVSINLSRRQLVQADLAALVLGTCKEVGTDPAWIVLEFGEDLAGLDTPRVQENLTELRKAGVAFALDRFGSGLSSLARLNTGHHALLKIDRKFVAGVPEDERSTSVLLAALSLARNLKMRPVVVGIENRQQKQLLVRLECEYGQGNFLAEPLPAETVTQIADRVFSN